MSETASPTTSNSHELDAAHTVLPRVLGLSQATAIVVGTIIGSGIFLVPCEMMHDVGSSGMVYLAWIIGGLLSLFGAMTYAELGAMLPFAGGEYVYLRKAYGDTIAFLYMWTWFIVAKPGSIAAMTFGLVRTLEAFPGTAWLANPIPGLGGEVEWAQLAAITVTWAITWLNILSTRKAGAFQLIFTVLKVVLVLVVVGFCFSSSVGSVTNYASVLPGATGGVKGFMLALIATLWAYDGWNDVNLVAGEVKNPQRNLPLALIGGLLGVGLLYMATNAAIQYVLPAGAIGASPQPAIAALKLVAGPAGASFVALAMVVSVFVATNGTVMSGARVPFAAARDGLFFKRFAVIHPRFESPANALVAQGLLATLLLLFLKKFEQFFELTVFAEWLFYALTASTVFVFRRRNPELVRPYRVWGYPLLPAVFLAAAVAVLVTSYLGNLKGSLLGTLLILAGIPALALIRRFSARGPAISQ